MTRSPLLLAALGATFAVHGAFASEPTIGTASFTAPAPHHGADLSGDVFYPAGDGGDVARVAENVVFHGFDARLGASPAEGRHPVVLLSHGIGGHVRSLAWLAAGLAERGAIVVGVGHPGSTFGDFEHERALDHWTRAQDLSAALDALLAHETFGPHVDSARIFAAGFSFGGFTALSLGGLRGDLAAYTAFCANAAPHVAHCRELREAGIDLTARAAAEWDASYADPRVVGVAAIDPGFHAGLTAVHAADLPENVVLIGLGDEGERLVATDFTPGGSGFSAAVPQARVHMIAPANHFSALPLCKPEGAALLAEEGDDPVCTDPPGTDRAAVHAAIIEAIATGFMLDESRPAMP
ncbi:alpha/beta hydrolase family protein [Salinarimonas ramus]|uniref:Dienelactone hydrolase n=1 Tax=Salinarimonas ramus TaxID=690164 RepID=A0A917V194_9HYPH|nr:alpha/beta hydrolase [Salinarimonas ramus]GGK17575.1 dienelactone hydrolase [Salinarimonas ramus]